MSEHPRRKNYQNAEPGSARDIGKPALDMQRVNRVKAGYVKDRQQLPDFGQRAPHPAPAR